jgi:glyoxylase-like metal-dependent hydrolase (beta-lactamase superfamily II)
MIKIRSICPDSFASNCYLLLQGQAALVVDPGVSLASIQSALEAQGAVCRGILLTHGHFDHILSLDELRAAYPDAPVYLHADDAELLSDGQKNAFALFFGQDRVWQPANRLLLGGEIIPLGDEQIRVIHTPGHTQGSVCYLFGDHLITGDTLFDGGYGRCDLYGGDWAALTRTLRRLTELPRTLRIYPGHGPSAALGDSLSDIGLV